MLDHLPAVQSAPRDLQSSMPSSTKPNAAKMRTAAQALSRILATRPATEREAPEYLTAMTECLAWLPEDELVALTHPATGLATMCKYLPTPADVAEFLKPMRDHRARLAARAARDREIAAFMRRDPSPEIPGERRKELVVSLLGRDPMQPYSVAREIADLPADYAGSSLPASPASAELVALVRQQLTPEQNT